METKVCSKCHKELPVDAFYKGNSKNGLDSYCKECRLQYNAEKREARKRTGAAKTQETKVEAPKPAETHSGEHHLHKIYYNKDLAKYPPRELMMELKARGYVGELIYTETIIKEHRINLARLN